MLAFNFVTKNVLFQLRHENIVIPTSSRFSVTVLESFVIVPCACFGLEESKRLGLTQLFLQLVVREYLPFFVNLRREKAFLFFVNLRNLVVGSAGGEGGWVFSPGRRDSTLLTPT